MPCCQLPRPLLSAARLTQEFAGASVVFGDVTSRDSIRAAAFAQPVDVVVSCLASRTGGKKDSWDIDYQVGVDVR
jgi:divinyl chlorophyllide a 8-vinyl-reductase